MKKVVVIGGGAAGMMAAYSAAINGASATLLEKNEKTGKKIYITGKGRCNLTNACEPDEFFKNLVSNSKFMYSAYYGFDTNMVQYLFEQNGCMLKTERGNRVFPQSDHSSDVIMLMNRLLQNNNVEVHLNTHVTGIQSGKVFTNRGSFEADAIVVATGGISYPSTGSTGEGYKWSEDLGHTVVKPHGALVPFEVNEPDAVSMQGLSLKNVSMKLLSDKKTLYEGFGEMLFTHFGISGPLVLSASSYYAKEGSPPGCRCVVDLKPALDEETLDNRLLKDFGQMQNKTFKNSMDKLLPSKMIPTIVKRSGIDENKKVNAITKEERRRLLEVIKNLEFTISGTRPLTEAIITQGGINVKEINPSTMESKICKGIYFAGEVMDVDALTGGFNLQVAWSTGYLAGMSAAID